MMGYSIIFCRARKGDYREGHPSRGNRKIEFLWTATPVALVLWIAGYSFYMYGNMEVAGPTQILGHLHMLEEPAYADTGKNNTKSTETIEVISKQWAWTFHYPQQNVASTELHLPVNRRAHLVLKSEDVLHGFYVPEFRIKQDIIPNRSINFQFIPTRVGKYRLHDSQFSGTYFAVMGADVYVDSPEDYSRWLSQAANHEKVPASNLAASEHIQPPNRVFKTSWKSIPPAEPPIVNYSG
jgi:cytochrome c oxidase subunit 2